MSTFPINHAACYLKHSHVALACVLGMWLRECAKDRDVFSEFSTTGNVYVVLLSQSSHVQSIAIISTEITHGDRGGRTNPEPLIISDSPDLT